MSTEYRQDEQGAAGAADNAQSPYEQETAITWGNMSRVARVAVSAGIVAVGAFVVTGPVAPVMAQLVGITQPKDQPGAGSGPAGEQPVGNPTPELDPNGVPVPPADAAAGEFAGGNPQRAGLAPNIQAVPPTVVKPQQPVVNAGGVDSGFGNVSSATPTGGDYEDDYDYEDDDDEDDDDDGRPERPHHGERDH